MQLISYIAPAAPATRKPATGNEPYLRPELGFTPRWYHEALGIDFGEPWHTDPAYRREAIVCMRQELKKRFPGTAIGQISEPDEPMDLLTGTFGACVVAALFGIPIVYSRDNWPNCRPDYLTEEHVDHLEPPDLEQNGFFRDLMAQVEHIGQMEGVVRGFINWQGLLNNAQRLRGEAIFYDLFDRPERCRRLFDVVRRTMIDAAQRLQTRQRESGFKAGFFTVSNCLVNMISPKQYRDYLLEHDQVIAEAFGCIGIHNCAWDATAYMAAYADVPYVGYIDMGLDSDLTMARKQFPEARRALMYTPMDLAKKDMADIREDLDRIGREYGPCDVVAADIEAGIPDEKVLEFVRLCDAISQKYTLTRLQEK